MNDVSRVGGTTDERMWDGKAIAACRRRRHLAPGVIGLCLVMVCAACFVIAAPIVRAASPPGAGPDCIQCPSGGNCEPNCGGGGCNPTNYGPVDIYNVATANNPTNDTLSWDESPAGSGTVVHWGNTTSYVYPSQSKNGGATSYSMFFDYLEPSTNYYFEIVASPPAATCTVKYTTGTFMSSFSTTSDSATTFTGTVVNTGGSVGSGMYVLAQCLALPPSGYSYADTYGITGSNGHFSVSSLPFYNSPDAGNKACGGDGAYSIQVENSVVTYPAGCGGVGGGACYQSAQWPGYWNETIVTWSPQFLNFILPANFVGPYVPQELEFTNSTYVTLSFNESVSVTTQYSTTAAGNGQITSSTFTVSNSGSATGTDAETWVEYDASGSVEFNAIDGRQVSNLGVSFYGTIQGSTTANLVSDPLSTAVVTRSNAFDGGLWYWYNITPGQKRGGSVTMSGTVTDINGLDIDVDVSADVDGYGDVGASIPIDVTMSTTQSYSNAFYFSVDNTDSVALPFTAYIQGGSGTEAGIIVHVWQM